MIGWYLDVLVGYLIRSVIRLVRTWRSKKWPIERATISSTTCPFQPIGGPVAEIGYTYIHNGEDYSGVYTKGFLLSGSAKTSLSWVQKYICALIRRGLKRQSLLSDQLYWVIQFGVNPDSTHLRSAGNPRATQNSFLRTRWMQPLNPKPLVMF